MDKRLYVKTYGCQMNVYDSMRMADLLAPLGYRTAGGPADADLIILNTCHIREKAAEKVYSELGRLRLLKEERARQGKRKRDREGAQPILEPPLSQGGEERSSRAAGSDRFERPTGRAACRLLRNRQAGVVETRSTAKEERRGILPRRLAESACKPGPVPLAGRQSFL